jgi:hypothetical protein
MPDLINLTEKHRDPGMQIPMGVGKNTDPDHPAKIIHFISPVS